MRTVRPERAERVGKASSRMSLLLGPPLSMSWGSVRGRLRVCDVLSSERRVATGDAVLCLFRQLEACLSNETLFENSLPHNAQIWGIVRYLE